MQAKFRERARCRSQACMGSSIPHCSRRRRRLRARYATSSTLGCARQCNPNDASELPTVSSPDAPGSCGCPSAWAPEPFRASDGTPEMKSLSSAAPATPAAFEYCPQALPQGLMLRVDELVPMANAHAASAGPGGHVTCTGASGAVQVARRPVHKQMHLQPNCLCCLWCSAGSFLKG